MTVKGIGKKEGNRLYRDWDDNEDGILYYEDPIGKILIRHTTVFATTNAVLNPL